MSDRGMRVLEPHDPAATYAAVLDALPIVAYMARPDGSLSYVSRGWTAQTGISAADVLERGIEALIAPEQRANVSRAWERARQTHAAHRIEFQLRFGDGSYRWVVDHAEPLSAQSDGSIVGWFGVLTDIDEQRRTEQALRESEARYRAFADALPGMTWTAGPDGALDYVGERWSETRGRPREGALGDAWLNAVHDEDRERTRALWQAAVQSGEPYHAEFRVRMADGNYRWQLVRALPMRDAADAIVRWIGVNVDIEDQRSLDAAYRFERARIEAGLRLLARTGAAAIDSLSYRNVLQNIADAFVEEFAAYCIIDTVSDADVWERTVAHRNPDLRPIVRDLSKPSPEHPISRAIGEGASAVMDVDKRWTERVNAGTDRAEAVHRLDVHSFITVAVRTPSGSIVGALTCGLDRSMERAAYVQDDLAFVEEVGRRAGTAIANALLYERERRIAVELQAASLPIALPVVDHLQLDADYRPGSDEATIGGDWYDAFALEDGRVVLTVGDVLGHGLHAAVTMSKLRQAMQSAAMLQADPCAMLMVADRTLRLIDPDAFATAFAGIYDRESHSLTFASAGHPQPLIRYADGRIAELSAAGAMLGLRSKDDDLISVIATPPEATIVLYTDGLIEASRDIVQGQRRLLEALERPDIILGSRPARALVEHVLAGSDASDDIAVLVVHLRPAQEPAANPEVQTSYADAEMHGEAEAT